MNSEKLLEAIGGIGDDLIAETGARLGFSGADNDTGTSSPIYFEEVIMHTKNAKKLSRTALIAAALAAVLAVTALAVGIFGTRTHQTDGLSGTWNNQSVSYDSTQMYLTFESSNPRHEVSFKANWLPSSPTHTGGEDYTTYITNDGEGSILPYQIGGSGGKLQGVRYTLNGRPTVTKQDVWNGFERTEIVVDYTGEEYTTFEIVNYLVLFQPEDNYMIYIAGTDPMETMEKIAENLDIRVGDVITQFPEQNLDICWFDVGRG